MESEKITVKTTSYIVTAPTGINLRYTPELNGKISHMVFFGDKVNVVDINGEWAQVLCYGKTLYIYAAYISK